jgi:hypothetical protein
MNNQYDRGLTAIIGLLRERACGYSTFLQVIRVGSDIFG